jgi:hypothetical protein
VPEDPKSPNYSNCFGVLLQLSSESELMHQVACATTRVQHPMHSISLMPEGLNKLAIYILDSLQQRRTHRRLVTTTAQACPLQGVQRIVAPSEDSMLSAQSSTRGRLLVRHKLCRPRTNDRKQVQSMIGTKALCRTNALHHTVGISVLYVMSKKKHSPNIFPAGMRYSTIPLRSKCT